jgi:hypothetical protein
MQYTDQLRRKLEERIRNCNSVVERKFEVNGSKFDFVGYGVEMVKEENGIIKVDQSEAGSRVSIWGEAALPFELVITSDKLGLINGELSFGMTDSLDKGRMVRYKVEDEIDFEDDDESDTEDQDDANHTHDQLDTKDDNDESDPEDQDDANHTHDQLDTKDDNDESDPEDQDDASHTHDQLATKDDSDESDPENQDDASHTHDQLATKDNNDESDPEDQDDASHTHDQLDTKDDSDESDPEDQEKQEETGREEEKEVIEMPVNKNGEYPIDRGKIKSENNGRRITLSMKYVTLVIEGFGYERKMIYKDTMSNGDNFIVEIRSRKEIEAIRREEVLDEFQKIAEEINGDKHGVARGIVQILHENDAKVVMPSNT